ncbi:TPM domain-containing protein [Kocuria sp.]|uniref:TPM domain-containing protein n=1 Tax=Kocuria sp. TaxID=1871328 RepID=UPI0026DFE5E1|nr:TPM domain-containing protein [Kocuria sp.]MDO5619827.1 TPM domain-containing protein [Kocuria sp.]
MSTASAFGALAVMGLLAIVVVAGLISWSRTRRRRAELPNSAPDQRFGPGGLPVQNPPQHANQNGPVPLPELHRRAGEALVATDNAVQAADQELAFAQLQFGDDAVAPYQRALQEAKDHLQKSFALQQKLEDTIADTEAEQRAWIGEILERCQQATTPLAQHRADFSQLRALEANAQQAGGAVVATVDALGPEVERAQKTLDRLAQRYLDSAWQTLPENLSQAGERIDFVRTAVDQAELHSQSGQRSQAAVEIRAAEQAAAQARDLVDSVHRGAQDLERAEQALRDAIAVAQRDVAEAEATAQVAMRTELTGTAAGVRSVLTGIEAELAAGRFDPYALSHRLSVVTTELEKALAGLREEHERDRAARATLDRTLVSAQAAVTQAHDYAGARRGGIGAQSRTHLSEAERHLGEAQRLRATEPSTALNHANEAIRLATASRQEAQQDVSGFSGNGGYGSYGSYGNNGGWGMGGPGSYSGYGRSGRSRHRGLNGNMRGLGGPGLGGAVLGGILLGSVLNGLGDDDGAISQSFGGGFGDAPDADDFLSGLGDFGGFDF